MNLSKEAIEAIEEIANRVTKERVENSDGFIEFSDPNQKLDAVYVQDFANVVSEALTNPEIYAKAGLVSFEEMDKFLKWKRIYIKSEAEKALRSDSVEEEKEIFVRLRNYNNAQLFQIYQDNKTK